MQDAVFFSVVRHAESISQVLVLDDASPEGSFENFLGTEIPENVPIRFERNTENLGFAGTCNRGFELAGQDDCILLNSDTIVTPRFAAKLQKAAFSAPDIATATTLTNNGDICSVPKFGVYNDLPEGFSLDEYAALIERVAPNEYPEIPTCVGHCVYVRREAINKAGVFDAETFRYGYGEENDLACRFRQAGMKNVLDLKTYIYHAGMKSFGNERKWELIRQNSAVIQKRFPHYFDDVSRFCNRNPLRNTHLRVLDEMAIEYSEKKPFRVLHVLQNGPHVDRRGGGLGGTEIHVRDIIENERDVFHWSLVPTKRCYYLTAHLPEHEREYVLDLAKTSLSTLFKENFFDLIHLHHSRYFDHMELAQALAEHPNYIVSFHDYILVCPRFHLMTPFRKVCSGSECVSACGYRQPYIDEWRDATKQLLQNAKRRISFSFSTQEYVNKILHEDYVWEKVSHGIMNTRSLEERRKDVCPGKPSGDQPLRIAFLGNVPQHKGSLIVEELIQLQNIGGTKIEWQVIGKLFLNSKDQVRDFGQYERHELLEKLQEANPHLIAILSICPETYCMTLDEAWNAGIPVISTRFGAPAERVKQSGAGWVLEELDADYVIKCVQDIVTDWSLYEKAHSKLPEAPVRSVPSQTSDYRELYFELVRQSEMVRTSSSQSKEFFQYLRGFGLEAPRDIGFGGKVVGEVVNKAIWILDSLQLRAYVQKAANSILSPRLIRELKSLR